MVRCCTCEATQDGGVVVGNVMGRWSSDGLGGVVAASEVKPEMGRAVGCVVGEECGKLGNFGATLR